MCGLCNLIFLKLFPPSRQSMHTQVNYFESNLKLFSFFFDAAPSLFEIFIFFRSPRPPKQMEWCGADAVLCYWETDKDHLLFMIGPKSKWLRYKSPLMTRRQIQVMKPQNSGFVFRVLRHDHFCSKTRVLLHRVKT